MSENGRPVADNDRPWGEDTGQGETQSSSYATTPGPPPANLAHALYRLRQEEKALWAAVRAVGPIVEQGDISPGFALAAFGLARAILISARLQEAIEIALADRDEDHDA